MKPEAQRIAIAEECGWEKIDTNHLDGWFGYAPNGIPNGCKVKTQLPDYLNDLNVMHEAEKVLTRDQQRAYTHQLLLIFERVSNEGTRSWDYAHATAAQRAEAYLKTLNLWEETK